MQAVRRLAAHYRGSPDLLSEEEVRSYLLSLRQRGVARGTFQTSHYGLRFYYRHNNEQNTLRKFDRKPTFSIRRFAVR